MVKGTKRKIEIKKIANRTSVATSFTKRSHGLHSKASELCLLTGAQIAVLATPSSSKSNVSFFSFGHSSVEAVVSAFLAGKSPPPVPEETKETREDLGICMARKNLGLGFWWDDDEKFKSPEEISEAIESMKILLSDVKALRSDLHQNPNEAFLEKNKESDDGTADQTLVLDDTTEHDQILSTSDSLSISNNNKANLDEWSDMDLDQLLKDFDDDVPDEEEPIVSFSEETRNNNNNNNTNLDEWNDMDLDQLLKDFDDDLPDEEEPIVPFSEETWNSNNNALLSPAAGNLEEDMGLDFEKICEGLYSGEESNEFWESLLNI